jgi:hypothetical protein
MPNCIGIYGEQIPYLLIEHPTGVSYCGQVAGVMCGHPEVEGFVIPLDNKYEWRALEGSCEIGCCHYGFDEGALEWLRQRWPKVQGNWAHLWGIAIELDESRAELGSECWFPIRLRQVAPARPYSWESHYTWLDGKQGFLLMPDNCD